MRTPRLGVALSTGAHVLALGATMLWFSITPLKTAEEDSVPIDIISDTDFSKLTAGLKTAEKVEKPKPMADKVGEAMMAKDQAGKVVDKKPEIRTASAEAAPPPVPEAKPKTPDAKPDPNNSPDKPDEIAEALKKEAKKPDPKPPAPPKKPPQPKLDMSKIESKLALIDKRDAQRQTITNTTISTAALGTPTPNSQFLMQSWMGALRARIESFWDIPAGSLDVADLVVQVRVKFNRDGSLASDPIVLNSNPSPAFRVAAEASLRAIRRGAPYRFLPASQYESGWSEVELDFRPQEMFRSAAASAPR